jgi:CBS domain-containing protein
MPGRRLIPDVIREQEIYAFPPEAMVQDAVEKMAERRIGAILVMEGLDLHGIFTERDVLVRVMAARRDPDATPLREVMTADPDTLPPDARASEALELMRTRNYRHLPVLAAGRVVGIVSIRDLYAAVQRQLEDDIRERDAYIQGAGYGMLA